MLGRIVIVTHDVFYVSDGHHVISRIETHLSDGTTQISNTLTPETAQLLSNLHPSMFPGGCGGVVKVGHVTHHPQQATDLLSYTSHPKFQ